MGNVFIKNGRVNTMPNYDKKNSESKEKKSSYTEEEKDVQLESLRNQLDKIKKEKMDLENKEHTIQNLINKITQGE